MELRPGYKRTEIGVIPDDWATKRFDEVGEVIDGDRGINYPSRDEFLDSGFCLFLNAKNVTKRGFDFSECMFITQEKDGLLRKGRLVKGDIVLTTRGTVGNIAFFDDSVPFENIRINSGMVIFRNTGGNLETPYLYKTFQSRLVQNQVDRVVFGSAQPQLTVRVIERFQIPVPPTLEEQCTIAEVLSDVEALIAALDRLIAKKRAIKQGTMQQLLTGQTRLPGFSDPWKVKRLGEVLEFQVGFPFSSDFFNQKGLGLRLIKNRDLKSDDQVFHYNGDYDPAYLVSDGETLVGMDGDFLPCLWQKGPALLNQRVGRIFVSSKMSRVFAYYCLIAPLKAIEYATSSTTVKHLSHSDVENIEMDIPDIEEQRAIAAVLSDMDAEIAALEARREKTRALKQGLMQELLTGRTRLV